jgi:hypothetical protein
METQNTTESTPPNTMQQKIFDHSDSINWTQEQAAEYKSQQEAENNEPWCSYCHPNSGCDGDHGDECRASGGGGPIYKGPSSSVLVTRSDDDWARDLERIIAESKAIRDAPLSAFASEESDEELEASIDMDDL